MVTKSQKRQVIWEMRRQGLLLRAQPVREPEEREALPARMRELVYAHVVATGASPQCCGGRAGRSTPSGSVVCIAA